MRRFLLILTPTLLLALAACGGTQNSGTPTAPTGGREEVLASAAGRGGPVSTEEVPALEVPANAVQSFTLETPTQSATANGRTTVAGKIVNNGTTAATPTRVVVSLLDASGQTVSLTSFSDNGFTLLEPGASMDWKGEVRFSVAANQRLSITVEGVDGAVGQ